MIALRAIERRRDVAGIEVAAGMPDALREITGRMSRRQ
jgi:hypothetical protein